MLLIQVSEQSDHLFEAAPAECEPIIVQLHQVASRWVGLSFDGGLQPRNKEKQGFLRVSL